MLKFFILALGIHFICFNSIASENCNKHNSELKKAICYERNGEYKKAIKYYTKIIDTIDSIICFKLIINFY